MARSIVYDEAQKKEVEKDLALLALQLIEDEEVTLARGRELSEYILDNLEFIDDTEDMLDMLIELHEDWGIRSKMFTDLLKKYLDQASHSAGNSSKLDDVKQKLASLGGVA